MNSILLSRQSPIDGSLTRQRISQLKETVVPTTDVDDPLLLDPPRLIDFNWDHGRLTLKFHRPVNMNWVQAFKTIHWGQAVWDKEPENFSISGDTARISAKPSDVQPIINHFKRWLPMANMKYEETVRREKEAAEAAERQKIQDEIRQEELREQILKSVKI